MMEAMGVDENIESIYQFVNQLSVQVQKKISGVKEFTFIASLVFLCASPFKTIAQDKPVYKNKNIPVEERIIDLLKRMTPEEKFWQLFMIPGDLDKGKEKYKNGIFGLQVHTKGNSDAAGQVLTYSSSATAMESVRKINAIQRYFVEETRLGIPIIAFDEVLHGLVRDGATSFPQAIALAATWDTVLRYRVAEAIAKETKSRGIRQVLSPVINIADDVRWGRVEETYGEDPFLTSAMGVAFVSAFEQLGMVTTPKHFIANNGNGGRDSYPVEYNERILEEIYLAPFRACFTKGGSRSVMTSYNSLNGSPCTANNWLLNEWLKRETGFKGFVISDASAVGGANVLHYTAPDYTQASANAINNGLDVIFQTDFEHYKLFIPPFLDGRINEDIINEAVARVLRIKFEIGLFEQPYIDEAEVAHWSNNAAHKALANEAALKSIVLLKNNKHQNQTENILPLKKSIRTIAVIGTDAVEGRLGGYSGPGNGTISILDGIKNKLGKQAAVLYAAGCGRQYNRYTTVPSQNLFSYIHGVKQKGLQGSYFNNIHLSGKPAVTRVDEEINFRWTLYAPHPDINFDFYSATWAGKIAAPVTGTVKIGLEGNDGYRLYLNNKLVIDNWKSQTFTTTVTDYYFEKGKDYDIRIDFFESSGSAWFKLIWNAGVEDSWDKKIDEAVAVAKKSEVAVIVAGIEEGEGGDRAFLNLPGKQEILINKVAATGTPVVVILIGGSAITMSNWMENVAAIVDAWYPGEEGGNAVAAILFGDHNPSGKLPITFPLTEGQLPLAYNHKPTGRNDDYINLTGQPLFPFGFGLNYSQFEYGDLSFSKKQIKNNESTTVRCTVKNTGKRDGEEVVQLYIRDVLASVARPVKELKGFKRVFIKAGEAKEIEFEITPMLLQMLNDKMKWVVEPGEFRIMLGASSKDIRARGIIAVTN